ncbi:unnamed protein product [Gadus morhua 'NCC']
MYTHGKHTPTHTHTHLFHSLARSLSLYATFTNYYEQDVMETHNSRFPRSNRNHECICDCYRGDQPPGESECVEKDEQNKRTKNKRLKTISSSRCRCHAAHRMFVPRKKKNTVEGGAKRLDLLRPTLTSLFTHWPAGVPINGVRR